jgi:hypothetical protein
MKTVTVAIKGISPYSPGKYYEVPKKEKEAPADYEVRTWRERAHYDENGECFIPPMSFKKCLDTAAKFLSVKVPGKSGGKATFTKHFKAGVMVMEPLMLGVQKEAAEENWLFLPSNGQAGGSSRVKKCFPIFREWSGVVKYHILDETITKPIFETHVKESGNFIGVGTFRPENGGYFGRFTVEKIEWDE